MEIPLNGLIFKEFIKNECVFALLGCLKLPPFVMQLVVVSFFICSLQTNFSRIIHLELLLSNNILVFLNLDFPSRVLMSAMVTGVKWLVFYAFVEVCADQTMQRFHLATLMSLRSKLTSSM